MKNRDLAEDSNRFQYLFITIFVMIIGYIISSLFFPWQIRKENTSFEFVEKDEEYIQIFFNYDFRCNSITPLKCSYHFSVQDEVYKDRIIYENANEQMIGWGKSVSGFIENVYVRVSGLSEDEIRDLKENIKVIVQYDNFPLENRMIEITSAEYGYYDRRMEEAR